MRLLFNPNPQEVSVFYKVEINCGRLEKSCFGNEKIWTCPVCGKTHNRGVNASINLYLVGLERSEVKPVELWWMTVSLMGCLKSHHVLKQEAPPSTRWSSSRT